jgi:hypothetical protein
MTEVNRYRTHAVKITGSNYRDIERAARKAYNQIARLSRVIDIVLVVCYNGNTFANRRPRSPCSNARGIVF